MVLDLNIPKPEAHTIHNEQQNVHFVEYNLSGAHPLPFSDVSMDSIEMNHIWTPLALGSAKTLTYYTPEDTSVYYNVLIEACRVLVPGGILSITEKEDRFFQVHSMVNGGILKHWLNTHSITEVTDPGRTEFTRLAIADGIKVYTLELKKESRYQLS